MVDVDGVYGTVGAYVLEHRLVMAKIIGRPLTSDEFVHHIDFNKSNNDPSNLLLVDAHTHGEHHRGKRVSKRRFVVPFPPFEGDEEWVKLRCPQCGKKFFRRKSQSFLSCDNTSDLTFCCSSCKSKFNSEHQSLTEIELEQFQSNNLVCEFKTNGDFMHAYLLKRHQRDLIDDEGVYHPIKGGYMYEQTT